MAVTRRDVTWTGATGNLDQNGASYRAQYRVWCDSLLDGPVVVWNYFRANGPFIFDTYAYGNDVDESAILQSIGAPRRVAVERGSGISYDVDCNYGPLQPNQINQVDNDGNPTLNPLDFRPKVTIRYSRDQRAVEKAVYRSGFTHIPPIANAGQVITPQNSATEPFDPPLERDEPLAVITVEVNRLRALGANIDPFFNCVNSQPMAFIAARTAMIWTFAHRTLKLQDVQVQQKRESVEIAGIRRTIDYVTITSELHWNPREWRVPVYDRGFKRLARAGDPDGRGGTLSASDLPVGVLEMAVMQDHDGLPTPVPCLLDGAGQPKAPNDKTPVVLEWSIYEELDLLQYPYIQDVFV